MHIYVDDSQSDSRLRCIHLVKLSKCRKVVAMYDRLACFISYVVGINKCRHKRNEKCMLRMKCALFRAGVRLESILGRYTSTTCHRNDPQDFCLRSLQTIVHNVLELALFVSPPTRKIIGLEFSLLYLFIYHVSSGLWVVFNTFWTYLNFNPSLLPSNYIIYRVMDE